MGCSSSKAPPAQKERIYCVCGGTRGDTQPLILVAVELQKKGYECVMCVGKESKPWVEQYGFEMLEFSSFQELCQKDEAVRPANSQSPDPRARARDSPFASPSGGRQRGERRLQRILRGAGFRKDAI